MPDKFLNKYKKSRLHVDKEIYKKEQYVVQNLIVKKKERKKEILKTNSRVSVNLKIYGKLLNHLDYLINLVDV